MASAATLELVWWASAWSRGIAPLPHVLTYLSLALAGLAVALALRMLLRPGSPRAPFPSVVIGTVLAGVAGSLFLPLKFAIPAQIPFWLDVPLAEAERLAFGTDPWVLLNSLLGWAIMPMDRVYGLWLPTQLIVFFTVLIQPPSPQKSRCLIAYSLIWLLLGVCAALLLSSAGPIFYDRLFGGWRFAALGETLHASGAWMVIAEASAMWSSFSTGEPGFVAGISAMPSIHVAISLWIYLVARTLAPSFGYAAFAYFVFIWIASVQLGLHYLSDGVAGAGGTLAIWFLAGRLDHVLTCMNYKEFKPDA